MDRFGILDEKQRIPGPIGDTVKMQSAEVARRLAGKGAVLLKNEDDILPVDFSGKKVAEGFHYSSDNNTEWIGVDDIRALLKEVELEK